MEINEVVFILVVLCFLAQLFFILFFYLRVSIHQNNPDKKTQEKTSLIICARNEKENLEQHLESFLKQDYKDFELIVVNDRSWDSSIEFLNNMALKYPNLKVVDIPDNQTDHFGKKFALTLAIKAAKYQHLLFTDADCKPKTDKWIHKMMNTFDPSTEVVLGASTYEKRKGFLNKLIRFDTVMIAINYLGFSKAGIPYMGVGRNLAYKKKSYELVKGFKSHYHLASGDDDLLINQISNKNNTQIVLDDESITISKPKENWKSWIIQKNRHHTTNTHYKLIHKVILIIQYATNTLFYFGTITLLFLQEFVVEVGILFGAKFLLSLIINWKPFKILLCKDLLLLFPIYEFILLICQPIFQINWRRR
ncbi:MAG: glycosyltransferase [Bacteroidota bacterium]|nr:glycosyltransferase [Bacteroidota bacterium]